MRLPFIWQVTYKELLSTLRDRRTLISTILIPLLLIPLFTVGMPALLGGIIGGAQQTRQNVGIVGHDHLPPELRARLTSDVRDAKGHVIGAGINLVPVTDPLKAVQDGSFDVAISVPTALPTEAGTQNATIKLYTKTGSLKAETGASTKIRAVIDQYNQQLVARKLRTLGLNERTLTPVRTDTIDASTTAEKRSGQLAFLIPMFMVQFILAGAMATAIDSTAGEKERGTLEALLVSPVRRTEVVTGKLVATTLFALMSALFSVIGLAIAAPVARLVNGASSSADITAAFGGTLSVTPTDFLILLAMLISAALLISAILIAIAIFARSFKEAQTYIAPLTILIVLPAVALQFADFLTRNATLYAIPLINALLVILDTVKGQVVPGNAGLAILVNLAATVVVTLIAVRSFSREQVIFRN